MTKEFSTLVFHPTVNIEAMDSLIVTFRTDNQDTPDFTVLLTEREALRLRNALNTLLGTD